MPSGENPDRDVKGVDFALAVGLALVGHSFLEGLLCHTGLSLVGLCCAWAVGMGVGLALYAPLAYLARGRRATRTVVCAIAGLGGGLFLAHRLGAFAKLGGAFGSLALAVLIAAPASCIALALVLGATPALARRLRDSPGWGGPAIFVVLSLGALAATTADARAGVLLGYPSARLVLAALAIGLLLPASLAAAQAGLGRVAGPVKVGFFVAGAVGTLAFSALSPSPAYDVALGNPALARYVGALRWLSDWDRDGFSSLFGDGDCAPFDASVHPGAREIAGNGKDDNCRYGDARPRPIEPVPVISRSTPVAVNVLLLTFEALRPDHTTVYGYQRSTTPNLSRFAKSATRFHYAYANGGWTPLSLPSLFASALPRNIAWTVATATDRARILTGSVGKQLQPGESMRGRIPVVTTLPRPALPWWLKQRGMRTVALLPIEVAEAMRRSLGSSFDVFEAAGSDDRARVDRALELLEARRTEPFFLWIHFFGTHWPYKADPGLPGFGTSVEDAYDAAIAGADRQLGRVLDQLEGRVGTTTAVIVTADHGECFDGKMGFHGLDLRESALRVPLLVRGPGFAAGSSEAVVSLVDLMPTVLKWTGTPRPSSLEGAALDELPEQRVVHADLWRHSFFGRPYLDLTLAIRERARLEKDLLSGRERLARASTTMDLLEPLADARVGAVLEEAVGLYLERAVGGP